MFLPTLHTMILLGLAGLALVLVTVHPDEDR
jgi:hypothetical protein